MRISDWSSDVCSSDLPAQVRIPTTVVAVEGDWLVPLTDAVALVEGLGTLGKLRLLRSSYGHDAFLKERSEEHTSELQSLMRISYAVFCLKKKKSTLKHQ